MCARMCAWCLHICVNETYVFEVDHGKYCNFWTKDIVHSVNRIFISQHLNVRELQLCTEDIGMVHELSYGIFNRLFISDSEDLYVSKSAVCVRRSRDRILHKAYHL